MALAKAEETGLISEKNRRRKSRDGKKRKFTKQAIIKDWKKNKKRYLLALPLIAFSVTCLWAELSWRFVIINQSLAFSEVWSIDLWD